MRIERRHRVYSFAPYHPPAATIEAGSEVVLETNDCFDGQKHGKPLDWAEYDTSRANPATGPVFVRGAEPGDVLVAEVLDIKPGAVGLVSAHPRGVGRREWKRVALDGGVAVFRDDLRLPLEPVIGTIGVAPEAGSVPNSTPGDHGGNLDTPDVKVGTKVHLPVAVAGALFGLGDVHALQADGEVCGQGIEVEAEVAVRIDVRRGLTLKRPMIETDVHFAFCASAKTLEEAVPIALGDARDFLIRRLGVTDAEALMLISLVGDVRISQIVNPLKTVRACVPRSLVAE